MILINTAIDLKIDQDGQVKILEFEATQHAGCEGYRALTGLDMLEDKIYPWLTEKFGSTLIRPKDYSDFFSSDFLHKLYPEAKGDYSDVMETGEYPEYIVIPPRYYVTGTCSLLSTSVQGRVVTENSLSSFQQVASNKAYQNRLMIKTCMAAMEEKQEYSDELLNLFPASIYLPRDCDEELRNSILSMLREEGVNEFVIKHPTESQHNGIILANNDNIEGLLAELTNPNLQKYKNDIPEAWLNNNIPLICIQQRIQGKPIEKTGKQYDGTMRVFATIWFEEEAVIDHATQLHFQPNIHIHDGYWKLPQSTIKSGDDFDSCVSFCPSSIDAEDENKLEKIEPHFAKVKPIDMIRVKNTLNKGAFLRYFAHMFADSLMEVPADDLITDLENPLESYLGTMLSVNSIFNNFTWLGGDDNKEAESIISERLMDVYNQASENSFMRGFIEDIAFDRADYHHVYPNEALKKRLQESLPQQAQP